ncbi:MAG: response regulator [Kiritimatiellae bacterium]|nr:response regulator [Kiritimatiellia bacterium]
MKILVADDNMAIRSLVRKYLTHVGYEVLEASDGEEAWRLMTAHGPEIAILDWMMPGADGLELCRRYQERNDMPFMYFLLLTSKHEKKELLYALSNGAHDFQSKPIDREELLTRISVGERLINAYKKIKARTSQAEYFKESATQMEILAEERAKQLIHADRLISLGTLSAGLAHEISNALGYICEGAYESQYQQDKIVGVLRDMVERRDSPHMELVREYLQESGPAIESIHEGINKVISIVEELRMFSRQGETRMAPCQVSESVERALRLTHNVLKYQVTVKHELREDLPQVFGSLQQLEQVFVNLFKNAADAMEGQRDPAVLHISYDLIDSYVRVIVEDTGPGIPKDKVDTVWNAFYTTKPPEKGTGLGLSISRDIIEKHEGHISATNGDGKGCIFKVDLPIYREPED